MRPCGNVPKGREMDMHSREQYLETLREEYRRASKKEKGRILSEARKRTRLNRKVLIRKLAHPRPAGTVRRRGAPAMEPRWNGTSAGLGVVRLCLRPAAGGGAADRSATAACAGRVKVQRRDRGQADADRAEDD